MKKDFPKKWCIKRTPENQLEINNWFNKTFGTKYLNSLGYIYSEKVEDNSLGHYIGEHAPKLDGFVEITFEEFKEFIIEKENPFFTIQELTKFAEPYYKYTPKYVKNNKVCFEVTSQEDVNGLIALNCHGFLPDIEKYGKYYTFPKDGTWSFRPDWAKSNNYEIIKASDFIKNNTMENKKIIGYKAKSLEFENSFRAIMEHKKVSVLSNPQFTDDCPSYYKAKELNLLDIWFTPIYQEEEKIIGMGNAFDLRVNSSGIFHNSENITDFAKDLVNGFRTNNIKFGGYDVEIKEVTFKSVGCQTNSNTTLTEWLNVWEEYNKICKDSDTNNKIKLTEKNKI